MWTRWSYTKRQIKVAYKLILAAHCTAETRRILADQRELIAKLKVWGQPTFDAERSLQQYIAMLKWLEHREHKIKEEFDAKKRDVRPQ